MSNIINLPSPRAAIFGFVVYDPGGTCGPRIQQDLQFFILHRGQAVISLDGQQHKVPVDHVCILLPGVHEYFRFARNVPTEHGWCSMSFDKFPRHFNEQLSAIAFMHPLTANLRAILELGLSLQRSGSERNLLAITRLAETFFYAYVGASQSLELNAQPQPEPVERACQFIAANLEFPIKLTEVAHGAGVTINHLIRLFNNHLKTTPSRYLWRVRTRRGVELLRDTGLNISEIAYRVGFATPFHFSRLVKEHYGLSPRQLRQKYWQNTSQDYSSVRLG